LSVIRKKLSTFMRMDPFRHVAKCLGNVVPPDKGAERISACRWRSRPRNGREAHAWLDAAGTKVTGYPVAPGFTEIACFL
jgi:hypothetical protein